MQEYRLTSKQTLNGHLSLEVLALIMALADSRILKLNRIESFVNKTRARCGSSNQSQIHLPSFNGPFNLMGTFYGKFSPSQWPPPFQFYMIRYAPRASSDKPFLSEAGIRRGALFHSPVGRKLKAGNIVSRPTRLYYRQLLPHLNGSSMSCSQRRVHTLKLFLIDSRAEDRMLSAQPVHLWLLEFISGLRGNLSLNFRYFKIEI